MVRGSTLSRRILFLALPNILSNLTIPLLGLVDVGLAGHLEGGHQIGGVALGTTLFNLLYWPFAFLRMGTTGLVAQAHGEGDLHKALRLLVQSVGIALLLGGAFLLFRSFLFRGAMLLFSPEPLLRTSTGEYYRIVVLSAPAALLSFALNGWMIGMQNTWYPMVVSVLSNLLNVLLSSLLVLSFGLGLGGVAWGTFVAQWVGLFLLLLGGWRLFWRRYGVVISWRWGTLVEGLGLFFQANVYIFLRTFLLVFVTFYFTYSSTQMGAETLAVNTLILQLFTLFSYFTDGFAYAAEALVGHYAGARDRSGVRRVVAFLLRLSLVLALFVSLLYFFLGGGLLSLLTDQGEVLSLALVYLPWSYLIPLVGVWAFIWDGVYVGLVATREMFLSMLFAVAVFFAVLWFGSVSDQNAQLWLAFVSYLSVRSLVQSLLFFRIRGLGRPLAPPHLYFLSVGSTYGAGSEELGEVLEAVRETFSGGEESPLVFSPDVRGESTSVYANRVIAYRSSESVEVLTERIKALEGRFPPRRNGAVPLDVDVVIRDGEVLRSGDASRPYFRECLASLSPSS